MAKSKSKGMLNALLAFIASLTIITGSAGATRFVKNSIAPLRTVVGHIILALVGVGGYQFLKGKEGIAYQILHWIMITLGVTSISALLNKLAIKLDTRYQNKLDEGVNANPPQPWLMKMLKTSSGGMAGLGNAQVYLQQMPGNDIPANSKLLNQPRGFGADG